MSVNLYFAFRLQNPAFTAWEMASGHLTASILPAQICLIWRQDEAGLSTHLLWVLAEVLRGTPVLSMDKS